MPNAIETTCDDTLFCRALMLAARNGSEGVIALGRRLLARRMA